MGIESGPEPEYDCVANGHFHILTATRGTRERTPLGKLYPGLRVRCRHNHRIEATKDQVREAFFKALKAGKDAVYL